MNFNAFTPDLTQCYANERTIRMFWQY